MHTTLNGGWSLVKEDLPMNISQEEEKGKITRIVDDVMAEDIF